MEINVTFNRTVGLCVKASFYVIEKADKVSVFIAKKSVYDSTMLLWL